MTSKQLVQKIYLRLGKFKWLLLLCGAGLAVALFFYAKTLPSEFSTKATVFPLSSSNESSSASNAISQLLGGGSENAKSISQEASINITELATSRNTREAVAMQRLPEFNNKRIAELLIEANNDNKGLFKKGIIMPKDTVMLAAIGGQILGAKFSAKTAKSGILELSLASSNPALLTPVTNTIINKVSQFYIDLKIRKARRDYDFTVQKVDSLQLVLNTYDRQAIRLANTTRFVPKERIEYSIPKENLIGAKQRVTGLRDGAANNKEEALWRLQKATPIIAVLDKPERPFIETKPSALIYAIMGFILGLILIIGLLIAPIIIKYIEQETNKAIFGDEEVVEEKKELNVTTTA